MPVGRVCRPKRVTPDRPIEYGLSPAPGLQLRLATLPTPPGMTGEVVDGTWPDMATVMRFLGGLVHLVLDFVTPVMLPRSCSGRGVIAWEG